MGIYLISFLFILFYMYIWLELYKNSIDWDKKTA